ncbi:Neuron Navigator 1 [Manis pentadactyla]|nr:Neuron Navigator 1 [Manis pentadactyla]
MVIKDVRYYPVGFADEQNNSTTTDVLKARIISTVWSRKCGANGTKAKNRESKIWDKPWLTHFTSLVCSSCPKKWFGHCHSWTSRCSRREQPSEHLHEDAGLRVTEKSIQVLSWVKESCKECHTWPLTPHLT